VQIGYLPTPIGIGGKKAIKGFHSKRNAFGIIQAVDANDHRPINQTLYDIAHEGRLCRTPGQPAELRRLDANRENTDSDHTLWRLPRVLIEARYSAFVPEVECEICSVGFGLKAYEVVVAHRGNEPLMTWKCSQDFWWWKGNMVKKPDLVSMAALAERLARGNR
jgi:hypothetical protein